MKTSENHTSDEHLLMSYGHCFLLDVNFEKTDYIFIINVLTSIINGISSMTAVLGNALIMYVVWKTKSLHSPSNTLLCCLAFSDFLVGLLAQPAFVGHKIGEIKENYEIYCVTRIMTEVVGAIASGVSTLTLSAISVERLLAIKLHLRYKQLVTTSKILIVVGVFWVFFTTLVLSRFWVSNDKIFNSFAFPVLLSSFVVTFAAYIQIYRCVLRHQKQIRHFDVRPAPQAHVLMANNVANSEQHKPKSFNLLKYKKSTVTMSYILGIYLLCYVPFLAVMVARSFEGYTGPVKVAYICTSTLVFMNSSVNPLIYCWRISDIRLAVKSALRRLFYCARAAPRDSDLFQLTLTPRLGRSRASSLTRH